MTTIVMKMTLATAAIIAATTTVTVESSQAEVVAATGHRTVPVIFDLRDGNVMYIGGFDETNKYLN